MATSLQLVLGDDGDDGRDVGAFIPQVIFSNIFGGMSLMPSNACCIRSSILRHAVGWPAPLLSRLFFFNPGLEVVFFKKPLFSV